MGLNHTGTKLLIFARKKTGELGKTLMIGRQELHVDKRTLQRNFNAYGMNNVNAEELLIENNGFAESFLKKLGSTTIESIDLSEYEGATIIHDLNLPVEEKYRNAFDTVIESGSLEHIFNFPTAIKNCMEMIKLNGRFIGITPVNNFLGHGFYQFSPELYFRVFSKENGFEIESMFFHIDKPGAKWYEVKDANDVKERVLLCNTYPSNLFIMAKKITGVEVFKTIPQQSDYQNLLWKKNTKREKASVKVAITKRIIAKLGRMARWWSTRMSIHLRTLGTGKNKYFIKRDDK